MIPAQTDYYFFLLVNGKTEEAEKYRIRCATPNSYEQYYIAVSKERSPLYWSLSPYREDSVVAEFEDRIGPPKRYKYYSPVKHFIHALKSETVQEHIALAISNWTSEQQDRVKKTLAKWLEESDE